MKNLTELRAYVRDTFDLDSEDLTDSLLDTYLIEGFRKVTQAAKRWSFYEHLWIPTYGTTGEGLLLDEFTGSYPGSEDLVDIPADEIATVFHDTLELVRVSPQQTAQFPLDWTGGPQFYGVSEGVLGIYPTPEENTTLKVIGFRKPKQWWLEELEADQVPDCPDDAEQIILDWALAKTALREDDPELSAVYERQHKEALGLFRERHMVKIGRRGVVVGGGVTDYTHSANGRYWSRYNGPPRPRLTYLEP